MKKYLSPETVTVKYKEAQSILEASGEDFTGDISNLDLVEDTWD